MQSFKLVVINVWFRGKYVIKSSKVNVLDLAVEKAYSPQRLLRLHIVNGRFENQLRELYRLLYLVIMIVLISS